MKRQKIKATYRNGVIEPLDRIDLPEGQELEIEFSVPPKTSRELTPEKKKELIQKIGGSMKGTWGSTVEEMTLLSSQKDNHGIENFRFFHSKLSYNISVVRYLCAYIFP